MKQIKLTFENDGKTVHKEVSGFDGAGCVSATDFIEKALGTVTKTEHTNDFYVPEPVGLDQECKQYT
jgi:hypothetical protein